MVRFVSESDIRQQTGLNRLHIKNLREAKLFPEPVNIPGTHYRYYDEAMVEAALNHLRDPNGGKHDPA